MLDEPLRCCPMIVRRSVGGMICNSLGVAHWAEMDQSLFFDDFTSPPRLEASRFPQMFAIHRLLCISVRHRRAHLFPYKPCPSFPSQLMPIPH